MAVLSNSALFEAIGGDLADTASEVCDTQSLFTDPVRTHGRCRKLNPTCRKKSVASLMKQHLIVVNSKNCSIQKYCLV